MNEREKKKNRSYLIPVGIVLLLFSIVFSFIFINMFFSQSNIVNVEAHYNSLLKILNDKVTETKIVDLEIATSLITFNYKNNTFYIAGIGDTYVYDLSINITDNSVTDDYKALSYVLEHGYSGSTNSITRLNQSSDTELKIKYHNQTGKYAVGELGMDKRGYMTSINADNSISVICGDEYTNIMLDTYEPKTILESNQLYNTYKYIVSK